MADIVTACVPSEVRAEAEKTVEHEIYNTE